MDYDMKKRENNKLFFVWLTPLDHRAPNKTGLNSV